MTETTTAQPTERNLKVFNTIKELARRRERTTIGNICRDTGLAASTVHYHLGILIAAGLITRPADRNGVELADSYDPAVVARALADARNAWAEGMVRRRAGRLTLTDAWQLWDDANPDLAKFIDIHGGLT